MKKTIIIRKPKFMRNDDVMKTYINVAKSIAKCMDETECTSDQKYEMLKEVGECINKAAKAGGFLSTKDFNKWIFSQTNS